MNRRSFFKALAGLAAAPLAAKIAPFVPGVGGVHHYAKINIRKQVVSDLSRWLAEDIDRRVMKAMQA